MGLKEKLLRISVCVVLVSATVSLAFWNIDVDAAGQITSRSLELQRRSTTGGSTPSGVVNHKFSFNLVSTDDVGSILFEYCDTLPASSSSDCTQEPTGLSTTSATLGTMTGAESFTSLVNTVQGHPYLSRTAEAVTTGAFSVVIEQVTNPSTANKTFFVRISTYASTNATGSAIDYGTVAASTATQIQLSGTMPESLVFCAGSTVAANCSTTGGATVSFNQLFSPNDTAYATSQMAASTNASSGYNITLSGQTLQSGANSIVPMMTQASSTQGTSQFGMNLKENTTTRTLPFGAEVDPAYGAGGGNYGGRPLVDGGYDDADMFKFIPDGESGENAVIANSSVASDAQRFTASYIVNVPGSQTAGEYTTTLTYICTPTY